MIGEPEDLWLVASDAGYGFTVRLKEAYASKKAGKTLLNIPEGALVLPPAPVPGDDALVAVTSEGGKLLVFPVKDVPELARGKGNKLFDIPSKKFAVARGLPDRHGGGAEGQVARGALRRPQDDASTWRDLKDYRGQRAQRGSVLPRGWRTVDSLETEYRFVCALARCDHHRGARHRDAGAAIQPTHRLRRREQLARARREQHVREQHQRLHDDDRGRDLQESHRFIDARSMTVGSNARKNRMAFGFASVSMRLATNARQPCWRRSSLRPRRARPARSTASTRGRVDRRRRPI